MQLHVTLPTARVSITVGGEIRQFSLVIYVISIDTLGELFYLGNTYIIGGLIKRIKVGFGRPNECKIVITNYDCCGSDFEEV